MKDTHLKPRRPDAAAIHEQLPRRRRRLGLALVAVGVVALAAQAWLEWMLPYDLAALAELRRLLHWPALGQGQALWCWATLCLALMAALAGGGAQPVLLAVLCGLLLGSAYVTAGGAAAGTAMLVLVGIASLGWQDRREGGLSLLLATALAVAAWDFRLSDFPTLWMVAAVLTATFVWIDRLHINVNDKRLYAALAQRDELIGQLDQRSAELTLAQGARTELLASISHDLRQPLQAVRLFAEALQGRAEDSSAERARRQDLLRLQMRAADDAVAMLDQFSEFSAIEQGALQSHPEPVDVRELLDGVANSLQATHPHSTLRISVHGQSRWIFSDRTQLARLVQNLAGNAVRYSLGVPPAGPARVVLAVRPHTDARGQSSLIIDVVDNGRGIPPDKLDAIFEPYVQLAGSAHGASRGGRGLGLAIVRGLVVQLGLSMAPVRSRLAHGTRFRLALPAALCVSDPRKPPVIGQATPQTVAVAATFALPRLDGWLIALLDDEDGTRAALRAALEGAGATIVDATSLARLTSLLDDEPRFPDALVFDLDLGSGRPDGLAAVETLREQWDLQVPAVIVTGRISVLGTMPMPKRCALLGKPVALATLVLALRRLVPQAAVQP